MVVVPPDAAAARPPQSAGRRRQRAAPLDPDLEARLRRQRAQDYGRNVRRGLATWHQQHAAKRGEQLALQQAWREGERAAQVRRLAVSAAGGRS